jgi:hypothetical protein
MSSERPTYQVYELGKGAHHEPLIDDGYLPEAFDEPKPKSKFRECADTVIYTWHEFKDKVYKKGGEHD